MNPPTIASFLFWIVAAIIYTVIQIKAPHPYAVCKDRATETERKQCEAQVDFALSAGW